MLSRLIINADDFGLTPGVNRAIAELHRRGALTSATLMATGNAFDDAVAIAHANPGLGIGCHITLVDGIPAADPQSIPTLIGSDGKTFRSSLLDFVQALLRGDIREDDIKREALAQVQKVQRAGIDVTHLDTHKHTHLFPTVARPLLHVAELTSIWAVRNPFEPDWTLSLGHGGFARRLQVALLNRLRTTFQRIPQIHRSHVITTDGTLGISATGGLNGQTLSEILAALPPKGVYELCCHPGYNDKDLDSITTRLRDTRDTEREALLTVLHRRMAQPDAPELIHYGNLGGIEAKRALDKFTPGNGYEKVI